METRSGLRETGTINYRSCFLSPSVPMCIACHNNCDDRNVPIRSLIKVLDGVDDTKRLANLETKFKFKPFPPKIIWCYGIYPKLFDKMSDIEFHEGMPFDVEDITNAFLIIDDLMNEVGDNKKFSNLFKKKGNHHKDIL
ncbi:uncharacterized protein TNIN_346271 [Trichonephila inaurata madagascariensis]|uniref:Uncharacterized protein n=1 Tax=Trichonephila inaurata madagascariensis TaxID=2747483 RepID=A0A8X6XJL7_9ARAC|nr:uncharacterized protein TNIN_346271 [Trichonephila inaurata madagascariensis]